MPTITVDQATYDAVDLAARLTGMSHSQVVARMVQQPVTSQGIEPTSDAVEIYADYEGQRTRASFEPTTTRIDILDGPLAGRSFKSPSSAARAVISHYKPGVNPNRNGWSFWIRDDGSGRLLQSIRSN